MAMFGLKQLINYYGGKYGMCEHILDIFCPHSHYVEPFVGGGTIFWRKQVSELETINDLDRRVITFYEVCKDSNMYAELQGLVRKTLHSRALYEDARQFMRALQTGEGYQPSKPEQAWAFWYLCNGSFMGQFGGQWAYEKDGEATSHACNIAEKRALFETDAICQRLSRVNIECQPANQVIKRYDAIGMLFYCDPPYFNSDMGPYVKQKNGKAYSEQDFNDLLALLSGLKGKFILSCYPSALVSQYAQDFGWSCQKFDKSLKASKVSGEGSRPKVGKVECLYFNYNLTQTNKPTLFQ